MTPRERALAACALFPVPNIMIGHFPQLIGRDAPHGRGTETYFTDSELGGAIAMPASEAQLLRDITLRVQYRHGLEIGAYVGWSAMHILAGAPMYPDSSSLDVVDPFTESDGSPSDTEARFWANIEGFSEPEGIRLFRGASPEILSLIKPRHGWDFAFIDRGHTNGQPLRDIIDLLPCLAPGAVVVWHDAWIPGVREAIDWQANQGWVAVELPTASTLTICYQGDRPHWLEEVETKARDYVAVANA